MERCNGQKQDFLQDPVCVLFLLNTIFPTYTHSVTILVCNYGNKTGNNHPSMSSLNPELLFYEVKSIQFTD